MRSAQREEQLAAAKRWRRSKAKDCAGQRERAEAVAPVPPLLERLQRRLPRHSHRIRILLLTPPDASAAATKKPAVISRLRFEHACKELAVHLQASERAALQSISKDDRLFSSDAAEVERRAQKHEGKRAADARSARRTWERRKLKERRAMRKAESTQSKGKSGAASTERATDAYSRWRATLQSDKYYSHNLSREMPRRKPIKKAPKRQAWVGPLDEPGSLDTSDQ